jgi:hypothetical protein
MPARNAAYPVHNTCGQRRVSGWFRPFIQRLNGGYLFPRGVEGNGLEVIIEGFADSAYLCTDPWKAQLRRGFFR